VTRLVDKAQALAEERFITASGPGGQNVNKVATAVQLRVNLNALGLAPRVFHRLCALAGSRLTTAGEIVIDARNHRTQEANRREARERLAALVEEALHEPKARAKTRLNRVGKTQRLASKKEHGAKKALRGKVADW
jgi:ribosome-associated protein